VASFGHQIDEEDWDLGGSIMMVGFSYHSFSSRAFHLYSDGFTVATNN
jgi:hypothetical protein